MDLILAFGLGAQELIIIGAVVLLLFGATKIPQLMRGMGQGINEFKKGLKEGETDTGGDKKVEDKEPKEPAEKKD